MAPKTATAASKKAGAAATHPSYKDMVKIAIVNLKDRMGSSRQAIKKYIRNNNDLGATSDAAFDKHIAAALNAGEKAGDFNRPKGPSGPVKLAKKDAVKKEVVKKETATKTKTVKPKTTTAAKPATKKAATAAPKKTAPTKKKTTTAKANTSKKVAPKKTAPKKPAPAPAVVTKEPTVLAKTKSGRVQKSTAPAAAAAKTAAKKKTTTKKAAAPKKTAKAPAVKAAA